MVPNTADGTGASSEEIPMRAAVSTTRSGPVRVTRWA